MHGAGLSRTSRAAANSTPDSLASSSIRHSTRAAPDFTAAFARPSAALTSSGRCTAMETAIRVIGRIVAPHVDHAALALGGYDAHMPDEIVDHAYSFLRGHSTGDLRFDEHLRPLKYVIGPDGRLIAPVMVAMLQAVDVVLFVPELQDDAMEVQVTMQQFQERGDDGAAADRWRIYHGEPQDVHWAFLTIDAARFGTNVIDGSALTRSNPLAQDEARLCRVMNQEHIDDLRGLCAHYGSMEVEQPVMVGIDPLGIDVRALFDVVRVPATQPMPNADAAM